MERGGRPQPRLGLTGPTGIAAQSREGTGHPIRSGFRTKAHHQLARFGQTVIMVSREILLTSADRLGFDISRDERLELPDLLWRFRLGTERDPTDYPEEIVGLRRRRGAIPPRIPYPGKLTRNARRFLLTVAQCCRCDPNVGPVHKGYLRPVGRKGWLGECNTLSFLHGKADKRNGGESNES